MSEEHVETDHERLLHAVHDALKLLDAEAEAEGNDRWAGAARAILRGQIETQRSRKRNWLKGDPKVLSGEKESAAETYKREARGREQRQAKKQRRRGLRGITGS